MTLSAAPPDRTDPHAADPRGTAGAILIRTATTADLVTTAELHAAHLPTGLFPALGHRFLVRWHATFLDSRHAVAVVAVHRSDDGRERCVGFLLGALDRTRFQRELLSLHRFALAARGLVALVVRPRLLRHFARTRLRPYASRLVHRGAPAPETTGRRVGDLTAVAVSEVCRGSGIGSRLTGEFLGRCALAGTTWVELATPLDPPSAPAFYTATGWMPMRDTTTRDGVAVQHFGRSAAGRLEQR